MQEKVLPFFHEADGARVVIRRTVEPVRQFQGRSHGFFRLFAAARPEIRKGKQEVQETAGLIDITGDLRLLQAFQQIQAPLQQALRGRGIAPEEIGVCLSDDRLDHF